MDPLASINVDQGAEKATPPWRFDEPVARIFEEHVRTSVPFYDEIHRMIAELSDWFLEDSSLVYDLGTSTGEGILRLHERHGYKKLRFVAADASIHMIQRAKSKLMHVPNVQFAVVDLNKPFLMQNASLVMLVLTLQFIEPESRPRLLKEIYDGLHHDGALILVEKLTGRTPRFDEMWIELYHDLKRRNGITDSEISAKSRSLRGVLVPYSAEDNERLLHQAGFQNMDLFFKWYNWAGFIAIK